MNEFKCPSCDKTKPTVQCSNFMSKGRWICKLCFNVFGGDILGGIEYAEDIDQQAFAQGRRSSYDNK